MNKTVKYFGPLGPGTQAPIGGQAPQTPHWGASSPQTPLNFVGGLKAPHTPLTLGA